MISYTEMFDSVKLIEQGNGFSSVVPAYITENPHIVVNTDRLIPSLDYGLVVCFDAWELAVVISKYILMTEVKVCYVKRTQLGSLLSGKYSL